MKTKFLLILLLFIVSCKKEKVSLVSDINTLEVISDGKLISKFYYTDAFILVKKLTYNSSYDDSIVFIYNKNNLLDSFVVYRKNKDELFTKLDVIRYSYNTSNKVNLIKSLVDPSPYMYYNQFSFEFNSFGSINSILNYSKLFSFHYDLNNNIDTLKYTNDRVNITTSFKYDKGINPLFRFVVFPSLSEWIDNNCFSQNNFTESSKCYILETCRPDYYDCGVSGNNCCRFDTTNYYFVYTNEYDGEKLIRQSIYDTINKTNKIYEFNYNKEKL